MVSHKDCYSTFTSASRQTQIGTKYSTWQELPRDTASTSTHNIADKGHVYYEAPKLDSDLGKKKLVKKTYLIETFELSDKILKSAEKSNKISCRLAGINDENRPILLSTWTWGVYRYENMVKNNWKICFKVQLNLFRNSILIKHNYCFQNIQQKCWIEHLYRELYKLWSGQKSGGNVSFRLWWHFRVAANNSKCLVLIY